jgi:hypothetical protein
MTTHRLVLSVLAVATAASSNAIAQIPGSMIWQVSLDDGATWQGGDVGVAPTQSSVRVRLLASWDGGATTPPTWFLDTLFDATLSSAGASDSISQLLGRNSSGGYELLSSAFGVQRFASLLKVDRVTDTELPGVGASWVRVAQGSGVSGQIDQSNPIEIFGYTLALDGSVGTRTISGVWAPNLSAGGIPYIRLSTGESVQATFHDARIIVPSPAVAAPLTLACFSLSAARRRRGPAV